MRAEALWCGIHTCSKHRARDNYRRIQGRWEITTLRFPTEKSEVRTLHNYFRICDCDKSRNVGNRSLVSRNGWHPWCPATPLDKHLAAKGSKRTKLIPQSTKKVRTLRSPGESPLSSLVRGLHMWKSVLKLTIPRSFPPTHRLKEKSKRLSLGLPYHELGKGAGALEIGNQVNYYQTGTRSSGSGWVASPWACRLTHESGKSEPYLGPPVSWM